MGSSTAPPAITLPPNFTLEHGAYKLTVACPSCKSDEPWWKCYPGEYPVCQRCGVIVMLYGRTPPAECITPNGRIDGHNYYQRRTDDGKWLCDFCGRP